MHVDHRGPLPGWGVQSPTVPRQGLCLISRAVASEGYISIFYWKLHSVIQYKHTFCSLEKCFLFPSGHLHAFCVLRSRHLPWLLCLMAWLASSCCCAIGALCHAKVPCTTPSTPSLWWVVIEKEKWVTLQTCTIHNGSFTTSLIIINTGLYVFL